jgi:hypothetical protein
MALPSFIDVVTLTVSKRVDSSYVNGSRPLYADSALRYVSCDAVAPDAGDAVLAQAQLGVQRDNKNSLGGVDYIGSNASIIVASAASLFNFNAAASATTQLDPEAQGQDVYVPAQPAFSSSVLWV